MAGRKLFVGTLPDGVADHTLFNLFSQYGNVVDVFLKPGCAPGRQIAFVTFATAEEASYAKQVCDRQLVIPGGTMPCEIMVARNQGKFGQAFDPEDAPASAPQLNGQVETRTGLEIAHPKKLTVWSLPDGVRDFEVRDLFSAHGTVTDVFVKPGCPPGKQWAFVCFIDHDQALIAKNVLNGQTPFAGSGPIEVMFSKNQAGPDQKGTSPAQVLSRAQPQPSPLENGVEAITGANKAGPRKLLVGSLPDGVKDFEVREVFAQYGTVADIFVKPGCPLGKQWAFVTFLEHEQASRAKEYLDRQMVFAGSGPIEVMFARNQDNIDQKGMMASLMESRAQPQSWPVGNGAPTWPYESGEDAPARPSNSGPRKLLVGSLPDGVSEDELRDAFLNYGTVTDIYVKPGCTPGRQWAFVSFASSEDAQWAKTNADKALMLPNATGPCEVIFARAQPGQPAPEVLGSAPSASEPIAKPGATKIFVGSLPEHVTEQELRAEFTRFGSIVDVMIKADKQPGRCWAFVTYAYPEQAMTAKEQADRTLYMPGSNQPVEVMFARFQGKNGQNPLASVAAATAPQALHSQPAHPSQPPPPSTPPPASVGQKAWREYKTAGGLPYYHNQITGATQWEMPSELGSPAAAAAAPTTKSRIPAPIRPLNPPKARTRAAPY